MGWTIFDDFFGEKTTKAINAGFLGMLPSNIKPSDIQPACVQLEMNYADGYQPFGQGQWSIDQEDKHLVWTNPNYDEEKPENGPATERYLPVAEIYLPRSKEHVRLYMPGQLISIERPDQEIEVCRTD